MLISPSHKGTQQISEIGDRNMESSMVGSQIIANVGDNSHRIHGAAIYGNMDPINIPPMLAYIPAPWSRHGIVYNRCAWGFFMVFPWFFQWSRRETLRSPSAVPIDPSPPATKQLETQRDFPMSTRKLGQLEPARMVISAIHMGYIITWGCMAVSKSYS